MEKDKKDRESYPSDITDSQWAEIKPLLSGCREYKWAKRELIDAVLYFVKTGCQWRHLPHDFPPYSTVHSFYRRAGISGLWERILQHMAEKTRENAGRSSGPAYGIIDSQSVKTAAASEDRSTDGGGAGSGISQQTPWEICLRFTPKHDTKSGIGPAKQACKPYPAVKKFCADAGCRGTFVQDVGEVLKLGVDISGKIKPHGWEKLPWRWVAERTLSRLNNSRRLSKDFEISIASAEAVVMISHFHTLLKRL